MKKLDILLIAVPVGLLSLLAFQRFRPQQHQAKTSSPYLPYKPQTGPVPHFVTYHLGRKHLRNADWSKWPEFQAKYDPKNGYTLISTDGPDGCEYVMTLAPMEEATYYDREDKIWTYYTKQELKQVFRGVEVPLTTGRGVRIGDNPQQVERKIGKPTKQYASKDFLHYDYEYRGKNLDQAHYTFQKNKLRSIQFRSATAPGPYNPFGGCP